MMDEFLCDIYTLIFKEWVYHYQHSNFQIYIKEDDNDKVIIDSVNCLGLISFNPFNIIELNVTNKKDDKCEFYLHFQMKNLRHAKELFEEMCDCMQQLVHAKKGKILLCCSGGLTTSFFAERLNETAELLNLNYEFSATRIVNVYEEGQKYDAICLAPQVSYQYAKVKEVLGNKKIMKISPSVFARYDTLKMFEMIQKSHEEKETYHHTPIKPMRSIHIEEPVLCLSIYRNNESCSIHYRISGQYQRIIYENEIIKRTLSIEDIEDTLNTLLTNYSDISIVGISIPGVVSHGKVNCSFVKGVNGVDLKLKFSQTYHRPFIICNDVHSAAIGYFITQNKFKSFSFIFQPIGAKAEIATIINGKLMKGHQCLAGETKFLPISLSQDRQLLTKTPEGVNELLSKMILTLTSLISVEGYVISSSLLTDVPLLKKNVIDVLHTDLPEYDFEIIKIHYIQQYILLGLLSQCVEKGS